MTEAEKEFLIASLPEVVSGKQLAEHLKISPRSVQRAVKHGKLIQVGRSKYRREDIREWLKPKPVTAIPKPDWALYEKKGILTRAVILKYCPWMLKKWELPDLVAEVLFRLVMKGDFNQARVCDILFVLRDLNRSESREKAAIKKFYEEP